MHLKFSWKIDPREEYSNSPTIYNKNKQLMPRPSITKTLWWLSFTFCILGCRLGLSPADITHIQEYLFYNFSEMVLYLLATELTKFIWVFDTDAAARGVLKKRCFPVNFVNFLKTLFLQNVFGRLLLSTVKATFADAAIGHGCIQHNDGLCTM